MEIRVSVSGLDNLARKYSPSRVNAADERGLDAAVLQTEAEAKDAATRIIYSQPESRPSAGAARAAIGKHSGETRRRVSALVQGAGRRTGAYRASLTSGGTGNVKRKGVHTRSFGSSLGYAAVIESGSKPHVIRPRRKKALAFWGGSGIVVVKSVNHPGTKPRRVVETAAKVGAPRISSAYQRAFWRHLQGG
jgi:hypothetical protein